MNSSRRQTLRLLAAIGAGSALAGCSMPERRERLNFVLVHGAWHGPWCWEKLAPLLRAEGHQVTAVDLQSGTPLEQRNLASYVKRVTDALDAQSSPAVLVGHSSGGVYGRRRSVRAE